MTGITTTGDLLLHVEDDGDDAMLIGRALRKSGIKAEIRVVGNGAQATNYLTGKAPFKDRRRHPMPSLILLDLNMPDVDGHQFLSWRAERPELKRIPVVVLTSSNSETDIASAYEAGANAYLIKPLEHSEMREMLGDLQRFWFGWNRLRT